MATRIQRRHMKGWRKPEGAVYVGRGSKWGNPCTQVRTPALDGSKWEHEGRLGKTSGQQHAFVHPDKTVTWHLVQDATRKQAVTMYRNYLEQCPSVAEAVRAELAGRDLMCWCPPGEPCHADVLLEVANPDAMFTADQWNARYPVGTPVVAYPFTRPEHRAYDPQDRLDTVTRTPAWTLGHGVPVVSVEGYAGGISLEHVDVIDLYAATRGEPGDGQ